MHGRWWLAGVVLLGTAVLLLLPTGWARMRSAGRVRTVRTVPRTQVALVLGAGVRSDGAPSRILQGRLAVARDLHSAGKVRRILVSGSPRSRGYSEPVVMREYLLSQGVPAEEVVLDESGVDTWSSCAGAAMRYGLHELTVVTSLFHLRRSIALCRRAGIDAYGVGHDTVGDGLRRVSARGARREALATTKAFWLRRSVEARAERPRS